jgi:hypothetical protein
VRAYTRASTAIAVQPQHRTVVVSAWPKPEEWVAKVFRAAVSHEAVQRRLRDTQGDSPIVATILPPRYGMKGMYYTLAPGQPADGESQGPLLGVDPDTTDEPVEVVLSRAEKAYKPTLALEDALDADVRLTPLVVVNVVPASGEVTTVKIPLPQNVWGPKVVMPVF